MPAKYDSHEFEKELNKCFSCYPSLGVSQDSRYEEIRAGGANFVRILKQRCPDSREFSLAMTKIEEAVFWASAAIARNEK